MRRLKPATEADAMNVICALQMLRTARDLLKASGSIVAVARGRLAIKSVEGAQRHIRHRRNLS